MGDMSTGRQEAFEIFKRDYTQNSNIEDNKDALKAKYVEAKKLGEYVNKSRTKISKLVHVLHVYLRIVVPCCISKGYTIC